MLQIGTYSDQNKPDNWRWVDGSYYQFNYNGNGMKVGDWNW